MKTNEILEKLYEVSEEYPLQLCLTLNPDKAIIEQAMQVTAILFAHWLKLNNYENTSMGWYQNKPFEQDRYYITGERLFEIFNNEK